jgi:integrase
MVKIETGLSHRQQDAFGKSGTDGEFAWSRGEPQDPQKQYCPECGSLKLYKDGFRYPHGREPIQRWLCRDCGYRFSVGQVRNKAFKERQSRRQLSQICVLMKAKNLDTATEIKTVAGDRKIDAATAKGLLLQYELWLQKEGYGKNCRYLSCIRMLINSGADPYDPESVKCVIAKKQWKNGVKMQACYAYDAMTRMLKLEWEAPRYRQEEAFPFIPDEKEIDAVILGARSKRMAAYLQTLKETMADPSEALRLRWIDINGNVITINCPVKGHYPRPIQVSNSLISLLNSLPKESERIFPVTYMNMARNYLALRKKVAQRLNNPRILKISFVTFRHWAATMLYHQTRNILLVKKLLGHKKIENTMKYTQLIQFKDTDYDVTSAETVEEAKKLGEAGFEKYDEFNGIHLYRKPKRFVNLESQ